MAKLEAQSNSSGSWIAAFSKPLLWALAPNILPCSQEQASIPCFTAFGSEQRNVRTSKIRGTATASLQADGLWAPAETGREPCCFSHQELGGLEGRMKRSWSLSKVGLLRQSKNNKEIIKLHPNKSGKTRRAPRHTMKQKDWENVCFHLFISRVRGIRFRRGKIRPKKKLCLWEREERG